MRCGKALEYEVYDTFWVRPENVEVFEQNDGTRREVTLITCSNNLAQRLIVRLREF